MKKFLIASVAVSLMRNVALGQDAPSASASPIPSPAGTEETERVIVQVRRWTSRGRQSFRVLAQLVTQLGRTGSIHRQKARTLHLTKRCCVSQVSRRIRSGSFMSAANTQIYNTASTTCFSRKVFRVLARYW